MRYTTNGQIIRNNTGRIQSETLKTIYSSLFSRKLVAIMEKHKKQTNAKLISTF